MKEIRNFLKFVNEEGGQNFFIATITQTSGSTYRKSGARKLISENGKSQGLLTGGCHEKEIISRCLEAETFPFSMGLNTESEQDRFFGSTLGCQGKMIIEVDKLDRDSLLGLLEEEIEFSLEVHVLGAGPDCYPLRELLEWTGWNYKFYTTSREQVSEWDDLGWDIAFQSSLSPQFEISHSEKAAVILMSHSYPLDLEALKNLVKEFPGYIGILGPSQRREQLVEDVKRLYGQAFSDSEIERIHGPVGLKKMGRGEEAIALAIVADLQRCFYGNHVD